MGDQLDLLAQEVWFDGETYDPALDRERLKRSLDRVWYAMRDGQWKSLADIRQRVGGSESGISARLRDFRKPRFGSHTVNRKRLNCGLWMYQIVAR